MITQAMKELVVNNNISQIFLHDDKQRYS